MNKKSVYLCMLLATCIANAQTWTTVSNLQINVNSLSRTVTVNGVSGVLTTDLTFAVAGGLFRGRY